MGGLHSIAVEEFAAGFPDERQWFVRLRSGLQVSSLKEFFDSLGYEGRPELWSMFSCLLLTRSMWRNPEWYTYHARSLRKAMHSQKKHKLMRVPSLCVQDVLKN